MHPVRAATVIATVSALVGAGPAAAVTIGNGVSKTLHTGRGALVVSAASIARDKGHTCQAGDRKSRSNLRPGSAGDVRNPPVVACEQPPKSNLLTPDQIAKATAGALAALG
jgi:hypothetical protein